MRRNLLIATGLLLLMGGCSQDPSVLEQIDLRNKELDAIEKSTRESREALLARITALRTKMDGLIEEVKASLLKKIEEGENSVMARLSREADALAPEITAAFAKFTKYMDEQGAQCSEDISKTFAQLDKAKDALATKIEAAAINGDYKLQSLLESYAKEADRVIEKAKKAAASVQALEELLDQADAITTRVNSASALIADLDSKYRAMEESQLRLMEAVKEKTSDISSLEAIEDEHLRDLLQQAESLIDEMQDHRDRIESSTGEADNIISEMEDLLGYIQDDVIDGVGASMSDAADSYDRACELLEYFESFDISEYYDLIDEAFSGAEASYDDACEMMDELESRIADANSDLDDSIDGCQQCCERCQEYYDDAYDFYDEIMSVHW